MALFTPDEIVYNYGGLSGKRLKIDGTTYTIDYVKTQKFVRMLQANMTDGNVIPMNQDKKYDFIDYGEISMKPPTKPKAKGKR